jgi:hypothetical protein
MLRAGPISSLRSSLDDEMDGGASVLEKVVSLLSWRRFCKELFVTKVFGKSIRPSIAISPELSNSILQRLDYALPSPSSHIINVYILLNFPPDAHSVHPSHHARPSHRLGRSG